MAKLYYGSGNCSIDGEGTEIMGVEIRYSGAISIIDKTPEHFTIMTGADGILIFPITNMNMEFSTFLSNLFDYEGRFEIKSILVAGIGGVRVQTSINRVMDYAELIDTNAEDMDIVSEDMSAGYISGKRKITKTVIDKSTIDRLHTNDYDITLFNEDGDVYNGEFHVHKNGTAMSGAIHTEESQVLYLLTKKQKRRKTYTVGLKSTKTKKKIKTTRSVQTKQPVTASKTSGGY